jgi:WD and tetratricopeptide repeat-containing protein 1
VFVGRGDKFVACGSDDGRVYIYDAGSGLLLRALQADEDVANCVQVRRNGPLLFLLPACC